MGYCRSTLAIIAATAALGLAAPAHAEKTLRVVMHSDLKILDPIWTTAYIVRNHGYMIYDTLFAADEQGEIKPQMVDKYEVSTDKLTHAFTLRDGLLWHDGRPVPFMMPKRVAETDPNTQISDFTGSGPFIFKRDEWKPGDKTVYVKNEKYKPRSEPASGLAGGKVVKFDRVEWRAISDHQQAVNALLANEIDFIEAPPHDLLPLAEADPNVKAVEWNVLGSQFTFRPNWLHKPFDNPKVRQALFYAFNQEDFLKAVIGDSEFYKLCNSYFPCGTPLSSEKGMEGLLKSDFKKARPESKELLTKIASLI